MFGKRTNRSQSDDSDFPVDEFDQNAEAEMAEVTDEWAGDDEASAQPVRKSGSGLAKLIPFVAIGLAAAGGAGYFYLNYMGPKAAAPVPASGEVIAAAPLVDPSAETLAGEPMAVDPAVEAPVATDVVATSDTSAAAPELLAEAAPVADALPVDMAPDVAHDAQPMASEAVSEPIGIAQPEGLASVTDSASEPVLAPVAEQAEVVAPPAVELQAIQDVAPVAEVQADQSTALAELPVAQADVSVVETSPAAEPAAPAVASVSPVAADLGSDSTDTTMRLSVVEHQMSDIAKAVDGLVADKSSQATAAALTAQVAALESQVKALQDELRNLRANSGSTAPATAVKMTAAEPSSEPVAAKPQAAKKPATTPAPRSQWVLRAAQSGEAWVSRGAQGSLQSVKVGDSLPGIGRITNISQRDGVWVVVGTTGSLKQ